MNLIAAGWAVLHLIPLGLIVFVQFELRRPTVYGRYRFKLISERAWALKILLALLAIDVLLLMSTDVLEGML